MLKGAAVAGTDRGPCKAFARISTLPQSSGSSKMVECLRSRPPSSIASRSRPSTSSRGNQAAPPKQPQVRGHRPGFLTARLPEK